jgi:hypothetical protein
MPHLLANRWLMCRKQVRSGGRQLKAASAEHMLPLLLTIGHIPSGFGLNGWDINCSSWLPNSLPVVLCKLVSNYELAS